MTILRTETVDQIHPPTGVCEEGKYAPAYSFNYSYILFKSIHSVIY